MFAGAEAVFVGAFVGCATFEPITERWGFKVTIYVAGALQVIAVIRTSANRPWKSDRAVLIDRSGTHGSRMGAVHGRTCHRLRRSESSIVAFEVYFAGRTGRECFPRILLRDLTGCSARLYERLNDSACDSWYVGVSSATDNAHSWKATLLARLWQSRSSGRSVLWAGW